MPQRPKTNTAGGDRESLARSQAKIPEGAKPFALKSTRPGNNDGEVLYPKYIRVQNEAPEGATEPAEGASAPIAPAWLRAW